MNHSQQPLAEGPEGSFHLGKMKFVIEEEEHVSHFELQLHIRLPRRIDSNQVKVIAFHDDQKLEAKHISTIRAASVFVYSFPVLFSKTSSQRIRAYVVLDGFPSGNESAIAENCIMHREFKRSAPQENISVPSSFYISDNGIQNYFHPNFRENSGIKEVEFFVFNRYGEEIFYGRKSSAVTSKTLTGGEPELKWDGKINGKGAVAETYIWSLLIEDENGLASYTGEVEILNAQK